MNFVIMHRVQAGDMSEVTVAFTDAPPLEVRKFYADGPALPDETVEQVSFYFRNGKPTQFLIDTDAYQWDVYPEGEGYEHEAPEWMTEFANRLAEAGV